MTSDFILTWLHKNCDILFVTETHLCKGQKFKLEIFVEFHSCFTEAGAKHPRGGVSCFVTPEVLRHIEYVDRETPELIVIRFMREDTV